MQAQSILLSPPTQVLPTLIDELGQLRSQIKTLEAHEKVLADQVKALLSRNGGKAEGEAYKAVLYLSESFTIDPLRYGDLVDEAAFFDSISVSVSKAKRHVGEDALKAISKVTVSEGLRVEPKRNPEERRS